ncbi:MAG: response regulator transcription factor [Nitrospirae bacterium]|nr:response regulator transcription factor [Nitrospirota bacterium]
MTTKVIIIEDDPDIAGLVEHYLAAEGFKVGHSRDGVEGLKRVKAAPPDLVILDLMLPGLDGLDVCKALRANPATSALPILMLTAKGEESDKVIGLELGADDYLTKPFSPKELVARVKSLLRRKTRQEPAAPVYTYKELRLDQERHEVTFKGKEVQLTAKEFALLQQLLENPGRVLTREMLLDRVWGYQSDVTTRTVDVHIRRLREKIPLLTEMILTVKSLGYKLKDLR